MSKVYIIAEIGVNHNGHISTAYKLIDAAAKAGSDAVKFQYFHTEALTTSYAPKANYQKITTDGTETQQEMLKKVELSFETFIKLIDYTKTKKMDFIISPFDINSIEKIKKLNLSTIKIPSGEITNTPYLRAIGKLNKKIIMSTGMSTIPEIKFAINTLIHAGTSLEKISLLHCTTEYPTPFEELNLKSISTLKKIFGLKVGFSDHTPGIVASIGAVALGAEIIEKHFTLDKNMPGPDHKASIEPHELTELIKSIRNLELALSGDGVKKPSPSEFKNIPIVRKSIVALRPIKKGDILTERNITTKRPGYGLSPILWDKVIGKKAIRDFNKDEMIQI